MAGKTQEPNSPFFPSLDKGPESSIASEDLIQIRLGAEVMQLPEVEIIRSQPYKAVIEKPKGAVVAAVMSF